MKILATTTPIVNDISIWSSHETSTTTMMTPTSTGIERQVFVASERSSVMRSVT